MQMWKKITGACQIEAIKIGADWKTDPVLSAILKVYKDEILIAQTKQRLSIGQYIVKTDCIKNWLALPEEMVYELFSEKEEKVAIYPNGAVCIITEDVDHDDDIIEVLIEGKIDDEDRSLPDDFDDILEKIKGIVNSEGILLEKLVEARSELRRYPSAKRESSIKWIKVEFGIDIESASLQSRLEALTRKPIPNKEAVYPSDFMPIDYAGLPKDDEEETPPVEEKTVKKDSTPPIAFENPVAETVSVETKFVNPFANRWKKRR